MAISLRFYLLLLTILCAVNLSCYGEHLKKENQEHHKLFFVFGDSLFDAGNNQYLNGSKSPPSTSWPYGMNFNNHSTGRLSDGLIVPDFIALFAKMNLLPPFLKPHAKFSNGANFASAGGGVLEGTATGVMNLKIQISNFKKVVSSLVQKVGKEEAKKVLRRSVFLISLGGNDGNDLILGLTHYHNCYSNERRGNSCTMVIGNSH
ncbi:GDSL esterase/lipase 1 [Jatropha curcas]|uniref:GDSL esterase/lipase 1 n=1 Tax=Jatropha curcas TaxID=180498 RepID=UPI0018945CE9|nr:GDSL esterase/lipase 1 [Jatropha curcas]